MYLSISQLTNLGRGLKVEIPDDLSTPPADIFKGNAATVKALLMVNHKRLCHHQECFGHCRVASEDVCRRNSRNVKYFN